MLQCEHVLSTRSGGAGRITLDRPAKFNALTPDMVRDITALLDFWARDPEVHLVILDGAGARGFCSGGDVRVIYDSAMLDDGRARAFWAEEYRLDVKLASFAKPAVVFMTGTVMGGGVGLSAHARHRIVTGSTRLAMPEAAIGLVPDVGSTWLLSRAPGELGTHVALTGERIGAADAIALGLADYFVPEASLAALMRALLCEDVRTDDEIAALVRSFAVAPDEPVLARNRGLIDRAYAHDAVEGIVDALSRDDSTFARATLRALLANSPTSLKLTLAALRRARRLESMTACLQMEYRLVTRRLPQHDLREGVRAAVIDKDRAPAWLPAELSEVSQAVVDGFFEPLGDDELRL